jgi:hypothetical protein
MMRMSWAWALAFAGLGVSLAACKSVNGPGGTGSGASAGDGGAGGGGSGGETTGAGAGGAGTGTSAGVLPPANLHRLCCREPLEWLRTPGHRHPVPNGPCGDWLGLCTGQTLYEITLAYAASYDGQGTPIPVDLLDVALLQLEQDALAGQPVEIAGCIHPQSCQDYYDPQWSDAVQKTILGLQEYSTEDVYADWRERVASLDPKWTEVPSGDPGKAVADRLKEGKPSFMAVQQPAWDPNFHAILVVDMVTLDGGRVRVDYYDSNAPATLSSMECSSVLTECVEYNSDGSPYIEDGKLLFVANGVHFNDYVDFLAGRREDMCEAYVKGEAPRDIPVALDVQYTSGTTVWKEDGSSETLWSINKHRFVLDEDAKHVKEQLVRHQLVQGGEEVTMLDVWAKATGMIDRYALTPIVLNPAGQPAVMKTMSFPVNEDIWSPPVSPGLNDILLDCLEGELDACMASHAMIPIGDSSVNGMPCRDYNVVLFGTGYDVCVATSRCSEEGGLLLPVRLRTYAGGKLASEIALSDVWSPVFPPETFKVPEDCVPVPGAPGVEFCTPP